jgi:VRR-NUC domain
MSGNGLWVLPASFKQSRRPGTGRKHPEQSLQTHVASLLTWLLPPEVPWTAIGHGGGGKTRGMILKGMGLHAGWPDMVLLHRGRSCWIELKAARGSLSPEQKVVHEALRAAGGWVAVCRSTDEVRGVLDAWGIPTREHKPSTQQIIDAGTRLKAP